MVRTDGNAGTSILNAMNIVNGLRHSQHKERAKKMGASMPGSVNTDQLSSRRSAAKKRKASPQAETRRKEREGDESSYHQRTYSIFYCLLHPTIWRHLLDTLRKSVTVNSRKAGACACSIRRLYYRFEKAACPRQANEPFVRFYTDCCAFFEESRFDAGILRHLCVLLLHYLGELSNVPRMRLESLRIWYLTGALMNGKPIQFSVSTTTHKTEIILGLWREMACGYRRALSRYHPGSIPSTVSRFSGREWGS